MISIIDYLYESATLGQDISSAAKYGAFGGSIAGIRNAYFNDKIPKSNFKSLLPFLGAGMGAGVGAGMGAGIHGAKKLYDMIRNKKEEKKETKKEGK